MGLYHAFFPTWRFFENRGSVLRVQYRLSTKENLESQVWQDLHPPSIRSWRHLFWNPLGNEILTLLNQANNLILNLDSVRDPESLASFKFLRTYVESGIPDSVFFQFQIVELDFEASLRKLSPLLVSAKYFKSRSRA